MSTPDPVDVLVIGAGATGAAFSWRVANAGIRVLCLEQGGWVKPESSPALLDDWELHGQRAWHIDANVRRLPGDYPVNSDESDVSAAMYNAVGGSTILWSAHFPRFHPSDLRVRSLDGVADDWPLSYTDLEPYFDLNDTVMGVAGIQGDPAYPPKSPRQTPPLPLGRPGELLARAFDTLGWHWWPSDTAIVTADYDGRRACNNCGPCGLGCARRARASADVTYWPKAIAAGARLLTRARVCEITLDASGRADGVLYHEADGSLHHQRAKAVVLAANGIGTPRLLLNSTSPRFPDGLANSSGLVGKNFMLHPYAVATGIFDQPTDGHKGPIGCVIVSQEFYETDASRGFLRGYIMQVARSSGPLFTALGGTGEPPVPWGSSHHAEFARRFGKKVSIAVIGEDLPEPGNRVELDPAMTDSDGIPSPKLFYRLGDNSRKMMAHGIARSSEALRAAGAVDVLTTPLLSVSGWHLMGTARMGENPKTSVVDPWGSAHDVPNLYIVDGSIFVTGGGVNPTSTMQALALRIADRFIQTARGAAP